MAALYDVDIYLVGLGMFEMRQTTLETLEVLKQAKRVFHLTTQHEELSIINANTEDLGPLYWKPGKRADIYYKIAQYVVSFARETRPAAFVIEGNPMFFSDVSWNIAELGKAASLRVEALPGVSCIDVLPIQLGFEPGDLGLQIFEATQLVLYGLAINTHLSTLILQVGVFAETAHPGSGSKRLGTFDPLVRHLSNFFPAGHPAIFIRSTLSRTFPNVVFTTNIARIDEQRDGIVEGMTLYLPRLSVPPIDQSIRDRMGLS